METVKGLGVKNFIDYVLENSGIKRNQFAFALTGSDGYSSFIVAKDNEFICLGKLSDSRFIQAKPPFDTNRDIIAVTIFLDLCINKFHDLSIVVPDLSGNTDYWDECYK